MPTSMTHYSCLVISPSDVEEERKAVIEVLHYWNAQVGRGLGAHVEPVAWETHAAPELGGPPQEILNKQLLPRCDLAVAIFWSRLGTPTADYASGSLEEIDRLLAQGARVLVYFCTRSIPQERLADDQFQNLKGARKELELKGLVRTFDSVEGLREMVLLHITSSVTDLRMKATSTQPPPGAELLTAPRPDVRVMVANHVIFGPSSGHRHLVGVSVENHSPVVFHLSCVRIALKGTKVLMVANDALTGQLNSPRSIAPGDSLSFFIDPVVLARSADFDLDQVDCVVALDKIHRDFRSDADQARSVLATAIKLVNGEGK
ncbi:MAG: hypothetical protein HYZ53_20840 [Planctomycetes bacterium]|nr:hypothetical protein [Planctomycetota bacterium]